MADGCGARKKKIIVGYRSLVFSPFLWPHCSLSQKTFLDSADILGIWRSIRESESRNAASCVARDG